MALDRLMDWTADPKITRKVLRQALDDLLALDLIVPDDSYTLKNQYLQAIQSLSDVNYSHQTRLPFFAMMGQSPSVGSMLSETLKWWLAPLRRRRNGEPERSRRVLKISTAQWLDYFSKPPEQRPLPAVRVVFRGRFGATFVEFFEPGPAAAPAALAMSARDLANVFNSCYDTSLERSWFWTQFRTVRNRERGDHTAALRTVATALYRLDHNGQTPPDDQALVGPDYLEHPLDESPVSPGLSDESIPEINGNY